LIRRYSLLGVGTAVLALTRITRSIEHAFAQGALETILSDRAREARPLPGLDKLPQYDASGWEDNSVNIWIGKVEPRECYPKLPYFSGRLGFRESEYAISAALQALAAGASPEWSLLTVTHEMVHGHVRNLLSHIFEGDPTRRFEQKMDEFYERFAARVNHQPIKLESFLDSIRAIIFTYCWLTRSHGSLSHTRLPPDVIGESPGKGAEFAYGLDLAEKEELRLTLEQEYRNISEILAHVLDLHYFYCSRLSAYIPLIWRSWATVPHVRGDLRQYLLRSLLAIATKAKGSAYDRFRWCQTRLRELLTDHGGDLQAPTIVAARDWLENSSSMEEVFEPFFASLILVDLANHVLTSQAIRGSLIGGDRNLRFIPGGEGFEDGIEYLLSGDFDDEIVLKPTAFLVDRFFKKIKESETEANLEAETARLFLACCSNYSSGGE
jgi:hypothetical protein